MNGLNPIVNVDLNGDDYRDKNGDFQKAPDGIVTNRDGSMIYNFSSGERNWDYGTLDSEINDYKYYNYENTDGATSNELFDAGAIGSWSLSSFRALGNSIRKSDAKANGDYSYD